MNLRRLIRHRRRSLRGGRRSLRGVPRKQRLSKMMLMSLNEIRRASWNILMDVAESSVENWIDEDGDFTEEDADRIYQQMMLYIRMLRDAEITDLFDANVGGAL